MNILIYLFIQHSNTGCFKKNGFLFFIIRCKTEHTKKTKTILQTRLDLDVRLLFDETPWDENFHEFIKDSLPFYRMNSKVVQSVPRFCKSFPNVQLEHGLTAED